MRLEILVVNFNSIKVQLELLILRSIAFGVGHFNSIKVQLERAGSLIGGLFSSQFQFHKGTI